MDIGRKVLIIDDEIDLCVLLKSYFNRKNYEVHVSHNLAEGMAALKEMTPDILFIDNNLPDATGWEAVPGLATQYPGMFISLVSAFHPPIPQMPENSRYMVIEKPIRLSDLDAQFSNL